MTKVNPDNGNETKSDIFPWDIFKSDDIFFYQKTLKYFNDFQIRNFSSIFPNNGVETNSDILPLDILFSTGRKILTYFNDFYNWHFLIHCTRHVKI